MQSFFCKDIPTHPVLGTLKQIPVNCQPSVERVFKAGLCLVLSIPVREAFLPF